MILLLIAANAYRQREPSYLGHPLSYWVEPWQHHNSETPERVAAVYAAMDERAVRWLARQLGWQPSKLKEGTARLLNRFGDFTSDRDYDGGRRGAAVGALTRLGPRAKAAIPELEALSRTNVELQRDALRTAALGALVRIRGDSLQPYLERLRTASSEEWANLAGILAAQGTNAAEAVPILVEGLLQTNRTVWAQPTVIALGAIHSHPELSVPALLQQLDQTNHVAEYQTLGALANFGTNAASAWPELSARLNARTNAYDRQVLLHTLRRIDPTRIASTNWN